MLVKVEHLSRSATYKDISYKDISYKDMRRLIQCDDDNNVNLFLSTNSIKLMRIKPTETCMPWMNKAKTEK